MTRRAFLCGVNSLGLRYAARDAALLAACLEQHGYVVTQATDYSNKWRVLEALEQAISTCARSDTFLFYFSGHGRLEAGKLELLISDAQSLEFPVVQSELHRCPARDQLVILDCCHAGAAPVAWDFACYQSERYRLLTASQRLERTSESDDLQASFMTYHIQRLLTELPADLLAADQPAISLNRLYARLQAAAHDHNQQHPERPVPIPNLLGNVGHDLVLAVVTDPQARPFPPTLTPYLEDMIARFSRLRLPDGREVELERIYVSLTADQLNAAERRAEQQLLHRDVERLFQQMQMIAAELNIYTRHDAYVQAIKHHPRMRVLEAGGWEQRLSAAAPERCSLAEVVQRHHAVVLLGDPGAGKTTLGRWLVLQYALALQVGAERVCVPADRVRPGADTQLIDLDQVRLPIFVRIADYAAARWGTPTTDLTLTRFIETGRFLKSDDLPPPLTRAQVGQLAQQALAQRQALVVLDGLDEVGKLEDRRTVMDAIRAALQEWRVDDPHAANRVLLTSRVVGYQFDPLTDRPHYTVAEMDEAAITAFCQAWVAHACEQDTPAAVPNERETTITTQAQQLVDAILQHAAPSVRTLAGNPLLLTILAQVYWNNSSRLLPTRRADLFAEAAQGLYQQRADHWNRVGLSAIRLFRALAAVAYHLHAHEPIGFTDEGTVRTQLHAVLGNSEQVAAVLSAARNYSGFLVERGSELYGFLHRALQEFFVAHYLVDEDVPVDERLQRLRRHLLDPTWHEPLLLAAGRVASTRAPCYTGGRAFLPQVFAVLLETPDPAGAILPRRELLAAAACAECASLPTDVVHKLATRLVRFAMRRNEQDIPAVLFERIKAAFASLQACPDADAAYTALHDALQRPEFEQRLAALDVITRLEWYRPDLLPPLLSAWQTYPAPATLLLYTLEELHERFPEAFARCQKQNRLPLRALLHANPHYWQTIQASPAWQRVLQLLYGRLDQPMLDSPEQIVRDSPLTPQIEQALQQANAEAALYAYANRLLDTAATPGTVAARDAALLLSALGNQRWIPASQSAGLTHAELFRPVIAIITRARDLARALARALDLDLDLDRALDRALARARDLALALDRALALALALDLDLALALALARARDLALALALAHALALALDLDLDLALARDLALALDLDLARARARDLARARARDLARALARDLARDLARANVETELNELTALITTAQQRWAADEEITAALTTATDHLATLQAAWQRWQPLHATLETFARMWTTPTALADGPEPSDQPDPDLPPAQPLMELAADLDSATDDRRHHARITLNRSRPASVWGQARIEELARLARQHADQYLVGTYLGWALEQIAHDQPAWVQAWIDRAAAEPLARMILSHMHALTDAVWPVVLAALQAPDTKRDTCLALLDALSWIVRQRDLPEAWQTPLLTALQALLTRTTDADLQAASVTVLGHWRPDPQPAAALLAQVAHTLLPASGAGRPDAAQLPGPGSQRLPDSALVSTATETQIRAVCAEALGRWAARQRDLAPHVTTLLTSALPDRHAAAALVRITLAGVRADQPRKQSDEPDAQYRQRVGAALVAALHTILPDPLERFTAMLAAGIDDDGWDTNYHDLLPGGIGEQLFSLPAAEQQQALQHLVRGLEQALQEQDWPARRMYTAAVAVSAERMPAALQTVADQLYQAGDLAHDLEALLVRATTDAESFNSRRFALTALSYLRVITPAVVPALIAGCRDTAAVQQDTIAAAARFQRIEGDLLPQLIQLLNDTSALTAAAVARLLGALGVAGLAADQHDTIIGALAAAIEAPASQRLVKAEDSDSTHRLDDIFYTELLRVAGYPG